LVLTTSDGPSLP